MSSVMYYSTDTERRNYSISIELHTLKNGHDPAMSSENPHFTIVKLRPTPSYAIRGWLSHRRLPAFFTLKHGLVIDSLCHNTAV